MVFETGLPVISTDENRLKQVFINILDNAFKFTEPGGRVVFASSFKDGKAVFTITDTGCGIAREDLPNIRDKFYKGRSAKPGSGLGLSICDEIIRLMNGEMDIKSEVNNGTAVTITLPAVPEGAWT